MYTELNPFMKYLILNFGHHCINNVLKKFSGIKFVKNIFKNFQSNQLIYMNTI